MSEKKRLTTISDVSNNGTKFIDGEKPTKSGLEKPKAPPPPPPKESKKTD